MANPYSAAAAGLESGFGMGMRAREQVRVEREQVDRAGERAADRAAAEQERADRQGREAKQDKRLAEADARQRRLDELKVLDMELDDLTKEGSAMYGQYGSYDKVPEDVRSQFTGRVKDARSRRSAARRSLYEPDVQTTRREAAELASRLEAGQLTFDQLTPDQLYKTIQVQTKRPMSDFMRTDPSKPSLVEQAALDLEAGVQTGNRELVLRAANALLAPELKVGIGTEGRDGNEIVNKRIVQLAPHPQDPNQLVPILEVKVRRDDGSVGTYLAPATEGRGVYGTDPEAVPKTISVEGAFNRVGQLSTMAAFVNRPEVRKSLETATEGKSSADEFLSSLGFLGVAPPKRKIARERVDLGGSIMERTVDSESGQVLGTQRLGKTPTPRQPGGGDGPTAEQRNMAAAEQRLAQGVKEGLITEDEAREQRRKMVLGGGGKGQMTSPADLFKAENTLRDEYNTQSKTFTVVRDAYGKVLSGAERQKKEPTAAADIALIFAYMRMLDPNSVVREGEFATAQNAAGIPDRIRNMYNRAMSGNMLNNKQRGEIEGEAKKVFDQSRAAQNEVDSRYEEMAKRYELNPSNVVTKMATPGELPKLPADQKAATAAYQKLPSGARYIDPNGVERTKK
jgi:hypothetical protein